MIGKLRAFKRRFPNFWLASLIGVPIGTLLWLTSTFFPCSVILQESRGSNQCDIIMEKGSITFHDRGWHGAGTPGTNWWTLDHQFVGAYKTKFSNTAQPNEGWAYFLGIDLPFFERFSSSPDHWWAATWPLVPILTLLAWIILSLVRYLIGTSDRRRAPTHR